MAVNERNFFSGAKVMRMNSFTGTPFQIAAVRKQAQNGGK